MSRALRVARDELVADTELRGRAFGEALSEAIDDTLVDAAAQLPYALPNMLVDYERQEPPPGIDIGWWRAAPCCCPGTKGFLGCSAREHSAWANPLLSSFRFKFGPAWPCATAVIRTQTNSDTVARSVPNRCVKLFVPISEPPAPCTAIPTRS